MTMREWDILFGLITDSVYLILFVTIICSVAIGLGIYFLFLKIDELQ
jgi:hypothetical protein